MKSKKSLRELYDQVKFLTGLTQAEIAKRLKYERTYLSTSINSGDENETVRQRIELTFAKELEEGFERLELPTIVSESESEYKKNDESKNTFDYHKQIENEFLKKRVADLERIISLQEVLLRNKKKNEDSMSTKRTG